MKKMNGFNKKNFKQSTRQTNILKTNGRWKNFKSSIDNDTNKPNLPNQQNSRFKNFDSFSNNDTNEPTQPNQQNSRFKNFDSFANNDTNEPIQPPQQNSRFKNFDSFANNDTNEPTDTNSRFKNFDSSGRFEQNSKFGSSGRFEQNSKFGGRNYSKFGKKRIYKSRYKKEETLDYFKTQKNATQRDVSLFDFTTSKKIKTKNIDEPEKKLQENIKCEMTKEEKNFIINKYMYEEDDEDDEEEEVIEKMDDQTKKIIDF